MFCIKTSNGRLVEKHNPVEHIMKEATDLFFADDS